MFNADSLALLFARHASPHPCRCDRTGYCPAHGTYQPATNDPEVLEAVNEATRRSRAGLRVVRKALAE